MPIHQFRRSGLFWIEILLVGACVALLFQLYPSIWWQLIWAVDVRQWGRGGWIGLNTAALVALIGVRFRSELRSLVRTAFTPRLSSRVAPRCSDRAIYTDADYEARKQRDAEWRERARKRLPFT